MRNSWRERPAMSAALDCGVMGVLYHCLAAASRISPTNLEGSNRSAAKAVSGRSKVNCMAHLAPELNNCHPSSIASSLLHLIQPERRVDHLRGALDFFLVHRHRGLDLAGG